MRVCLIFRVTLVQLFMPLWLKSSLFPIQELQLWTCLYLIGSDGEVISEVQEIFTKIHYILANAVSKRVGNTGFIL